jgi:nucleoside-diphosphate-sugar epimerase
MARVPADDIAVRAWHSVDVLDPVSVTRVVRETQASHLLHLAWATDHERFWSDPANIAWVRATCSLGEAFVEAGGTRAVISGSCAQYSWDVMDLGASGVANETRTPRRPATLYGSAKQAISELFESWSAEVGLSYATGLVFCPYGPFEKPVRLVPSVARSLLAGEPAEVGPGTHVRDFIHVDDCGEALAALVDGDIAGAVNLGSGQGSSIAEVATAIARTLGREDLLRIGARPAREEAPRVIADIARLRDEVGVTPKHDLVSGIEATVAWWSARAAQIAPR